MAVRLRFVAGPHAGRNAPCRDDLPCPGRPLRPSLYIPELCIPCSSRPPFHRVHAKSQAKNPQFGFEIGRRHRNSIAVKIVIGQASGRACTCPGNMCSLQYCLPPPGSPKVGALLQPSARQRRRGGRYASGCLCEAQNLSPLAETAETKDGWVRQPPAKAQRALRTSTSDSVLCLPRGFSSQVSLARRCSAVAFSV